MVAHYLSKRCHSTVLSPIQRFAAGHSRSTLWGVRSDVILCKAFLKCSTGRWADTAATVQPNWEPELPKEKKRKHNGRADATQCMQRLGILEQLSPVKNVRSGRIGQCPMFPNQRWRRDTSAS